MVIQEGVEYMIVTKEKKKRIVTRNVQKQQQQMLSGTVLKHMPVPNAIPLLCKINRTHELTMRAMHLRLGCRTAKTGASRQHSCSGSPHWIWTRGKMLCTRSKQALYSKNGWVLYVSETVPRREFSSTATVQPLFLEPDT